MGRQWQAQASLAGGEDGACLEAERASGLQNPGERGFRLNLQISVAG